MPSRYGSGESRLAAGGARQPAEAEDDGTGRQRLSYAEVRAERISPESVLGVAVKTRRRTRSGFPAPNRPPERA